MMENLTINDPSMHGGPPQGGQMPPALGRAPPPQPQQLPPQMFTTAAQLLDLTDSMDFVRQKRVTQADQYQRSS
jgi:U6 snRNA-associated Sm-like protein LSm1